MYLQHYGLRRKPFDISPDPRFLWLGEKHREALSHLKYAILENKGFVMMTGDIGTGKTAIIKQLLQRINGAAIVVTVPDPDMDRLEFFNYLSAELGMGRSFQSKGAFLIHFKQFLLSAYSRHRKVLLIIDEAQRLSLPLLEEIRLLGNVDLGGRMLLGILLVGQTELRKLLQDEGARPVRQRLAASYHIEPLSAAEIGAYVRHRLKVAGLAAEVFTQPAILSIARFTGGIPRLINILCDHAMVTGYAAGKKTIDAQIIHECVRELNITFASALSKAPAEVSAAATHTVPQRRPVPGAVRQPYTPQPRRSFDARKWGYALAAMLLLGLSGYALHGRLFDLRPAKTRNEVAMQTLVTMLKEQPAQPGDDYVREMPFGHELGEDMSVVALEPPPEPIEPGTPLVRGKIEVPAAEKIEVADTLAR